MQNEKLLPDVDAVRHGPKPGDGASIQPSKQEGAGMDDAGSDECGDAQRFCKRRQLRKSREAVGKREKRWGDAPASVSNNRFAHSGVGHRHGEKTPNEKRVGANFSVEVIPKPVVMIPVCESPGGTGGNSGDSDPAARTNTQQGQQAGPEEIELLLQGQRPEVCGGDAEMMAKVVPIKKTQDVISANVM